VQHEDTWYAEPQAQFAFPISYCNALGRYRKRFKNWLQSGRKDTVKEPTHSSQPSIIFHSVTYDKPKYKVRFPVNMTQFQTVTLCMIWQLWKTFILVRIISRGTLKGVPDYDTCNSSDMTRTWRIFKWWLRAKKNRINYPRTNIFNKTEFFLNTKPKNEKRKMFIM
jgi:hypothetical protein